MEGIIFKVIGTIIGLFKSDAVSLIKKFIRNRKNKNLKNLLAEKKTDTVYRILDSAIPQYDYANITLNKSDKKLFIEIPDKYKEELAKYRFEIRNSNIQDFAEIINTISNTFTNLQDIIEVSKDEIAKQFLDELKEGHVRFNGLMFGVERIRPQRLTSDEKSGFETDFYTTDYFTYRVLGRVHDEIQRSGQNINVKVIQDLNKYNLFTSSFGLATFVIVNRGYGDEILMGRRSNGVVFDKEKWHFSMNEAFSMNDKDEYGNPSLSACLFRGLKEELGISEKFKKNIVNYGFLDLCMILDRFEVGISSYVRLRLDESFSYKTLLNMYSIAQDGKLETSSIKLVPVKEIEDFIEKNKDEISAGCEGALKAFYARYEAGYFRESE